MGRMTHSREQILICRRWSGNVIKMACMYTCNVFIYKPISVHVARNIKINLQ